MFVGKMRRAMLVAAVISCFAGVAPSSSRNVIRCGEHAVSPDTAACDTVPVRIARRGIIIVGSDSSLRAMEPFGGTTAGGAGYAGVVNSYKSAFGDSVAVYCMPIPTAVEFYCPEKAKDKTRLSIIRQVMGEVKNVEVNERRDATEQDVTNMIRRLIKQTSETLEMSEKAGTNQERTDTLREQVEILESLLPAQVSGEALVQLIETTIAEVDATTKKDMGRVMGALNQATGGNFDKAAAAKEVGSRLA